MAKQCVFTGRKAVYGNRKTYRGKAKYLGGVGKKITGPTCKRSAASSTARSSGCGYRRRPSAADWSSSRLRSSRSRRLWCKLFTDNELGQSTLRATRRLPCP